MIIAMILTVGIVLLSIPLQKKLYWKYCALIFILISAGYFFYNPPSQDDLYRHYQLLDEVRKYELSFFDSSNHYWAENPLYVIYIAFISIFQANAFLPFSVGVIYYLTCLYGIKLVSFKNGQSGREMIATIAILMTVNYIAISGIRNMLGCALFLIGMYMDMILNKKCGFIFYALGALIHSAILLYVLIRLMLIVYKGKMKYVIIATAFVIPFILFNYSDTFLGIFSGVPLLAGAISRFQLYTIENAGMEVSNNWRFFTAINYLFLYFMAFLYERYYDTNYIYKKVFAFFTILLIIAFGFWNQREMFGRHMLLILPLGIMYFVLLKNSSFLSFPRVALLGDTRLSFRSLTPFTCLAFVVWTLFNFVILSAFYYPDFAGNFTIF